MQESLLDCHASIQSLAVWSEQVDLAHGISSNYACINCCGNSFYEGWVAPTGVSGFEGDQAQVTATQRDANCYGQPYPPYQVVAGFDSFAPSICDSTYGGMITGVAPGQTSIRGGWTADSWFSGLSDQCEYTPLEVLRDALCEVLARDLHFTHVSYDNVNATFNPGAFTDEATLNVGNASDGARICSGDGNFTISIQFTFPQGGTVHDRADPRNRILTGANHQFEWVSWDFDEVDSLGGTGRMHLKLFRKVPHYPIDHVDFTITGNNPPGTIGGFMGKGRVHLSCP